MLQSDSAIVELTVPESNKCTIPLEEGHVQIGRVSACDIVLPDTSVSRRHARLEQCTSGLWRIVDLGSKNGTYVNGRVVCVAGLFDGDTIQIGNCCMTMRLPESGPDAELELDAGATQTLSVCVDATDIPGAESVPIGLLTDLEEAIGRLNQAANVEDLLHATADEYRSAMAPDRIAVGVPEDGRCNWIAVLDGQGAPVDGSDLSTRLVSKVDSLTNTLGFDWHTAMLEPDEVRKSAETGLRRCYVFPLKAGTRSVGYVYVEYDPSRSDPDPQVIRFLALLARQAGQLIENARSRENMENFSRAQWQFEQARLIQRDLFPVSLDLHPRLDIAAENHPYFEVSGDYYDCQLIDKDKVAFVLGDVAGHGLHAALRASLLHAVFRMGLQEGWDLVELDGRLDRVMQTSSIRGAMATGLAGVVDMDRNVLQLICAGHPWPSILVDGQQIGLAKSAHTYPWGAEMRTGDLRPVEIPLTGAWSFVAYTDGLIEARDESDRQYTAERFGRLHAARHSDGAQQLCERLLDDVLGHMGRSSPPQDDMTILAIRS